jgi:hypothetical protein
MKRIFFIPVTSLFFIGCMSEVDKCVEAQVKAINPFAKYALESGASNIETKEEVEARARLMCMQAAQGKL